MHFLLIAFLYASLVFAASMVGAVTGNGGGIIMKPVMDMIGTFNASEIAVLTSFTVLSMSAFSTMYQTKTRKSGIYEKKVSPKQLILLVAGSVGGGLLGEYVFFLFTRGTEDALVTLVQNVIFIFMIGFGFYYISHKDNFCPRKPNTPLYPFTGLLLGMVSSLLGIGGGTLNIACLMLLFSLCIKEAAFCSLSIVLAAQTSKLILTASNGGFSALNSKRMAVTLCLMIIAGVTGGFIGSALSSKISDKAVVRCFYGVQTVILFIVILNIIRFSAALSA